MAEISDELCELVSSALDLAVNCFAVGESNPIILFVDGSGQRHMIDFKDAKGNVTPELVEAAREFVSERLDKKTRLYAIAFDGFLTSEGERTDAAFVEAGERGQTEAVVIAQSYRVKKRSGSAERIGGLVLVQTKKQLLVDNPTRVEKPAAKAKTRRSKRSG